MPDPVIAKQRGRGSVKSTAAWFVDGKGEKVYGPFEAAKSFRDGLAAVSIGGKWGAIDTAGKLVVEARFERLDRFSCGLAPAREHGSTKMGYVDQAGSWVIAPVFDCALPLVDGYGAVVVGAEIPGAQPLQSVPTCGNWGVVDRTGKLVLEPVYGYVAPGSGGPCLVNVGGRANGLSGPIGGVNQYIDLATGGQVGKLYEGAIAFSEGLALARLKGKHWAIIDATGREVAVVDALARARVEVAESLGVPSPFSCGRAVIDCRTSSPTGARYVIIDATGKEVLGNLGEAASFHEGMAAVNVPKRRVRSKKAKEEKASGAPPPISGWGFTTLDGQLVTRPEWNDVVGFSEGRGLVVTRSSWRFVDRNGELLFEKRDRMAPFSNGLAVLHERS